MIAKANPRRLPPEAKRAARRDPGGDVLLPTGAKLYWRPGKGYWVAGYTATDAQPYLR